MRWNTLNVNQVCALSELLLGAALADRQWGEGEAVAVSSALMKALGVLELPPEVTSHIQAFDLDAHDPADACARLGVDADNDRRSVLKLIGRVVHADKEVHEAEDAYVRKVAALLGVAEAADAILGR